MNHFPKLSWWTFIHNKIGKHIVQLRNTIPNTVNLAQRWPSWILLFNGSVTAKYRQVASEIFNPIVIVCVTSIKKLTNSWNVALLNEVFHMFILICAIVLNKGSLVHQEQSYALTAIRKSSVRSHIVRYLNSELMGDLMCSLLKMIMVKKLPIIPKIHTKTLIFICTPFLWQSNTSTNSLWRRSFASCFSSSYVIWGLIPRVKFVRSITSQ